LTGQRRRLLAVLNGHIRPPNKIQNRRNKQTYDTYAFTIDIVPLVLQDYYFAGLILEYNGIIVKMRHQRKRYADPTPKNKKTTHPTTESGPNTGAGVAQAHSGTDHTKTVASELA
jgi:hypothetical protein